MIMMLLLGVLYFAKFNVHSVMFCLDYEYAKVTAYVYFNISGSILHKLGFVENGKKNHIFIRSLCNGALLFFIYVFVY